MRADRLLSLLLLLQNRGRATAPELAAALEVSVRTVYRDVEALGAAGIPVTAERGPAGGYRLMEGYRTRLTGLTDDEADALFLVGTPDAAQDLGLGAVLTTARLKLQAALPDELAARTTRIADRFHLDAPGWFRDADRVPFLAEVARAVWEQRPVDVHYRGWRSEVRRRLRPLGIVLKGGIWYLVAQADGSDRTEAPDGTDRRDAIEGADGAGKDGQGNERAGKDGRGAGTSIRTYRISRLRGIVTADDSFARPPGFDLAAHWRESTRRLEAALHQGTARLRVSPRVLRLLPMQFGSAGADALAAAGPADGDGWTEVELPVEALPVAVGDLLRLGDGAEVLGPPELRRAVAETAAAVAARYGSARAESTRDESTRDESARDRSVRAASARTTSVRAESAPAESGPAESSPAESASYEASPSP